MRNRIFLTAALLPLLLCAFRALYAAPAADGGTAACVYQYGGDVRVMEPGSREWIRVEGIVPLREGCRVRTGRRSWCRLLAGDGTFVNMYEDSETVAETLKLDEQGRDCVFELVKGRVLWMVARLERVAAKFRVRTPSAVCAVRGTDFFIGVSSDSSRIAMFDGQVDVLEGGGETALPAGSEAVAGQEAGLAVSPALSPAMEAEKRRYLKLRKHVETLRRRLAAREISIEELLKARRGKLRKFEDRRREKLNTLDK
ncbi:MAG TPA: FecR family protein [Elusimicrobiales bacterium]|nr:FecR family protein [Elusimicrobiales bacterium]